MVTDIILADAFAACTVKMLVSSRFFGGLIRIRSRTCVSAHDDLAEGLHIFPVQNSLISSDTSLLTLLVELEAESQSPTPLNQVGEAINFEVEDYWILVRQIPE